MNRNINPGNITTYKTDAVSSEIEKISEATGASLYPDRTAPRSVTVDGEAVGLTFEQRSMYQKAYPDDFSARTPLCMALYTVHHSTYCATEQDFKANGGTGFFRSM